MTTVRRRRREDLPLRGRAPRPQQGYVEAVKQRTPYSRRAPDQSSEAELRQSGRFLLTEKQGAESPFRIPRYGIRFVDARPRKRPWPVVALVRPRPPHKLPVVLRLREVRSLLALVVNPTARMGLPLIEAGGLRLREGTQRQGSDLASQRRLVRVRQGKGGTDRFGPRAPRVLAWLRAYWQRQQPHPGLFPARHQQRPLPATTLQTTFTLGVRQSGIPKDGALHRLRHSDATPLFERGVLLRVIQARLGHQSPRTTARSTPRTPPTLDVVHATIPALRAEL